MKFLAFTLLFASLSAYAGDPDLTSILGAVRAAPCSQVQVVIAPNLGAVRWEGGSMRYLYAEDIAPLQAAVVDSGKLPIAVDQPFEVPNTNDPNWSDVYDRMVAELNRLFTQDRVEHPADHCKSLSALDDLNLELNSGLENFIPAGEATVPRLAQVTPNVYRGGRPNPQGLQELARRGIKTIIDLEDDSAAMRQEQQAAAQLRMNWVSEPMSASVVPNDREVNQILTLLQDASRQPIFIHCKFGEDRTGLIIGLYRVLVQHWPAAQAYQEMLHLGFHPQFKDLDNYFRTKTGFRG